MGDERWLDGDAMKALLEPVAHFELFRRTPLPDDGGLQLSQHGYHGAIYTHLDLGNATNPAVLVEMNHLPRAFTHYRDAQSGWPHFFMRREGPWSEFRRFFTNRVSVTEPESFDAAFVVCGDDANAIRSALTAPVRQRLLEAELDPELSVEVDGAHLLAWTDGTLRDTHRHAAIFETRKVTEALMLASS